MSDMLNLPVHVSRKGGALISEIEKIAEALRSELVAGFGKTQLETALRVISHIRTKAEGLQ